MVGEILSVSKIPSLPIHGRRVFRRCNLCLTSPIKSQFWALFVVLLVHLFLCCVRKGSTWCDASLMHSRERPNSSITSSRDTETILRFQEEKKTLKERLQAVQEITAMIQNVLGQAASLGERVKKWVITSFTPYGNYKLCNSGSVTRSHWSTTFLIQKGWMLNRGSPRQSTRTILNVLFLCLQHL